LIIFEISNVIKKPFYFFGFIRDINTKEYDIVIDFEQWSRITSILTFLINSGYKIGFKTKGEFKHLLFNNFISHSSACHEKDNYAYLINSIGVNICENNMGFPILPFEMKFVENLLKEYGISENNLILFNPWSSGYRGYLKEWGTNNFINLAKLLISEGYNIGIVGTVDNESKGMDIVRNCGNNVVSFCGKLSLGQTAYLIKKSRLLITVNTGIMHLGAALNHPIIALHGPAGVLRWGPVSSSSNIYNIQSDIRCAPCLNLGFEYKCKNGGCMDLINIETVIKGINGILKENYITKEDILGMSVSVVNR
jgi:heptosyltransferase I